MPWALIGFVSMNLVGEVVLMTRVFVLGEEGEGREHGGLA